MKILAILFLLIVPEMVMAQSRIKVRSGEHESYTRITFSMTPSVNWNVDNNRIQFGGEVHEIDISEVFERISRNRVSDVLIDGNNVSLKLGCDCSLSFFETKENLVVVDVFDEIRQKDIPITGNSLQLPLAREFSPVNEGKPHFGNPATSPMDRLGEGPVSGFARAVTRSASLGLVDLTHQSSFVGNSADLTQSADFFNQVRAHTSADFLSEEYSKEETEYFCPLSESLPDLVGFEKTETSAFIEAITSDTEKIVAQEVLNLADLHIARAQGAEAKLALSLLDADEQKIEYRKAIADFIDTLSPTGHHPFDKKDMSCSGDASLWAFFHLHQDVVIPLPTYRQLAEVFQSWPPRLRHRLSPYLSRLLVEHGQNDIARIVLRANLEAPPTATDLIALANLEASHGEKERADNLIAVAGSDLSMISPEIYLSKLAMALKNGTHIEKSEVDKASAMLAELGSSRLASDLQRVVTEAYVATGDVEAAINTLLDKADPIELAAIFWAALKHLSPAEYSWAALAYWEPKRSEFSSDLNERMEESIAELGFGKRAVPGHELIDTLELSSTTARQNHSIDQNITVPKATAIAENAAEMADDIASFLKIISR